MLEDPHLVRPVDVDQPRADLVVTHGAHAARLWMGGAHALRGEAIEIETARRSWIIDCAGDVENAYREAAGRFLPIVFLDVEEQPSAFNRIREIASEVAARLALHEPGQSAYVLCTHGMNRSGLVTGLVLRELGYGPEETVRLIRAARPGSLSNHTFVRLLGATP
ncbi:MAG: hypothetical protein AB7T37_03670 [Dehalococcoidia bacterium]